MWNIRENVFVLNPIIKCKSSFYSLVGNKLSIMNYFSWYRIFLFSLLTNKLIEFVFSLKCMRLNGGNKEVSVKRDFEIESIKNPFVPSVQN